MFSCIISRVFLEEEGSIFMCLICGLEMKSNFLQQRLWNAFCRLPLSLPDNRRQSKAQSVPAPGAAPTHRSWELTCQGHVAGQWQSWEQGPLSCSCEWPLHLHFLLCSSLGLGFFSSRLARDTVRTWALWKNMVQNLLRKPSSQLLEWALPRSHSLSMGIDP